MSDRPDNYFYMYTGDYLRDTMHLTTRQHGAYMLLLMYYYGKMKCLPASEETLRTIARLSEKDWKTDGPVVMAYFNKEDDGWHQARADKEIVKAVKRYDKAVAAAAAKHGRKHEPSTTRAGHEHEPSICLEAANPNPNHSRNPLRGVSTRGARRAAAQGQAAAPPDVPRWEENYPKWAEFREKIGEAHWVNWFAPCRPNGSEKTLLAPSEFAADQIRFRYLATLNEHFGGGVFVKFEQQKQQEAAQ